MDIQHKHMKKIDSAYFEATYKQIQVSKLLKACLNEVTRNGRESYVSVKRDLNFKERNHMTGWWKGKILQVERAICKAMVIGHRTESGTQCNAGSVWVGNGK